MSKLTKAQQTDRDDAVKDLRKLLRPGQTVYTILRNVSRSGMQREISLAIVHKGEIVGFDWLASRALGYRRGKRDGLVVGGCGMDMRFHIVYTLGRRVWPDGTKKPHGRRNGEPDRDGGYALKHRWL